MLLLLCALLLGADKAESILPLTGSKSDHLEVQAGGLVLREGEAGAAFGAAQVGKGKRQLTYFLVLKHDLGKAEKTDFSEEANADNADGDSKQTISLDGRSVEVVYKVRVESGKKVSESLTVNKKTIDLSKGRVLLVDLTATTPTVEQRKADLPAEVEASNKKSAAELARKVLASLAKQDKKVKEFIDKAAR
jgi:hypothetical protein